MSAGRGDGWVLRPVRPVGVLASRNLLTDLTLAKSRDELRMVLGSQQLSDGRRVSCRELNLKMMETLT